MSFKKMHAAFASLIIFFASNMYADTPTSSNTIKVNAAFEFNSIDPSVSGYLYTRMQVLETLVDVNADGNLTAGLATSWTTSDDGLTWSINLRPDVVFHNGQKMTVKDVISSLKVAKRKQGPLKSAPIDSILAGDQGELVISLTKPYKVLPAALAHYSTSILPAKSYSFDDKLTELVGTGPYKMYEFKPPHKLVVEKFDQYWGQVASVPFASYLTGHRAEARVLQARSGQADIVFGLDPAAAPMLARSNRVEIIQSKLPRTLVLKVNAAHPFLKEVQARQALSLAIERKGISMAVLRTPDSATTQLLPSSMSNWFIPNAPKVDKDLDQARALLKEIGWEENSDGILQRDGQPFALHLITYADRPELTTVATALQAQWKKLGVDLKVDITNSSAIPAGHQDGTLNLALIARNYGFIVDPLLTLIKDFGQESGGDWGSMNWHNPQIQVALKGLVNENNPDRYRATAQAFAEAVATELPVIPIASYTQQTSVNKRIEGFRFDPFERNFYLNKITIK
ncbi:ABC transporter substrate-binding protein [Marinomonas balearica]|uniref:Peptide/nickel transport system substrate-binding protein n=1 Tax=Marinomonas balearica TaxID=491947 RepID=A0A4R6M7D6_9GAMM|nr:ABC transporter substrate-binding protein [Marinomonas balearica]TDO97311.1 peptide/nickel transport system substrate-binding protein [Marinomonas balearica]